MATCRLGWPSCNVVDLAARYHERSEDGKRFKVEFDSAAALMSKLLPSLPQLLPVSDVSCAQCHYVDTYFEMAFATEADLVRHVGFGAKALKLKPSSLQLEDGSGRIQGHYLSLAGMPPDMKDSLRRVRVGCKGTVVQNDRMMTERTQVRPGQAADVMSLLLAKNVAARNPPEKSASRSHLVTFETLMGKAECLRQVWTRCGWLCGHALLNGY